MIIDKILALNLGFVETFGYLLVFLGLFIESLPFIGAFIPGGSIILFLAGFLSRLGFLNLWVLIIVASLASICIDSFGYWLGRYHGKEFLHKYGRYFFIKKGLIEKIGGIIYGNPGKALILGRFNPATRAIAPFLVGSRKVKFGKFFLFNIIGGVLWVVMLCFLGYLFGNSLEFAQTFERGILIVTIFLAIAFYGFYVLGSLSSGKNKDIKCKLDEGGLKCDVEKKI